MPTLSRFLHCIMNTLLMEHVLPSWTEVPEAAAGPPAQQGAGCLAIREK